jgi:membrane protein
VDVARPAREVEPRREPERRRLAVREWPGILVRAAKDSLADDVPMLASALAFNAFLAIPATLLLVVGLFSLLADPSLIGDLMDEFGAVLPGEAVTLLQDSLLQLERQPSAGVVMTIVGLVLALWTTTGAMNTLMTAINRAHDIEDDRSFVTKRLVAVVLVVAVGFAVLAVAVLLVLGPHLQDWIGSALDAERVVGWTWWTAQWPILLVSLLAAFSVVYWLAANNANRHWRPITLGAGVAVVLWIVVSAGFGFYTANFGSYNKTWGSLSAAIVTMVWLWLSSLALLFGAEVDAEAERVRTGRAEDVSDSAERRRASQLRRAG